MIDRPASDPEIPQLVGMDQAALRPRDPRQPLRPASLNLQYATNPDPGRGCVARCIVRLRYAPNLGAQIGFVAECMLAARGHTTYSRGRSPGHPFPALL